MKIETWLTPNAAGESERAPASVAIVIDVLRATTVATTALSAGAKSITTCGTVEEAFSMKSEASSDNVPMLCGERGCQPIVGFDFGNSPGEYSPAGVGERELILTTTNGTAAILAAEQCEHMWLACFANLSAVIDRLVRWHTANKDNESAFARIVCAGTNGCVTAEDVLLAGAIIAMCHQRLADSPRFYDGPIELLNDSGAIALSAWQHCITHDGVNSSETLAERLTLTQGGKNLIAANYANDLVDCGSIDVFDLVPTRDQRSPARFVAG
ncbi:2-phosphosulfolactate phosphatase [Rhodopirellula halodulae]|uniref:2-phosphosulfolactate phosphatase n=1 Tax=Rhodopirellula halodulae TaxID=2894198 RepID=UPI001E5DC907|nr:2-phosphosulfolactate phosphatase [Rhodopirellula sp. JC737]MCC9655985.1 2-phosphosulfolactate phosphatase [Rhodopirellula sp. JC737]